jgi:hypothetical protein
VNASSLCLVTLTLRLLVYIILYTGCEWQKLVSGDFNAKIVGGYHTVQCTLDVNASSLLTLRLLVVIILCILM